jgi:acetyltransferase-like isoleucine patch superfamily enzyme
MRIGWFMKRLTEKCVSLLKYIKLSTIYHPAGFVHVLGRIYLDNSNIKFGSNVTLYPNVHIFGSGKVTLEDNVSIGDGTIICAAQDITIGKNTMIAAQCYIIDCNHGMHIGKNMREQPLSVHPTKIGEDVWLGCGCKILAGAEISDGAVIGAGTVISGKVEENMICFTKREYQTRIL